MTQKEWEKKLKRFLSPLPKAEQNQIVEYYREMYGDKRDAGLSEAEILAEFGDPQVCAGRMISENADTSERSKPASEPKTENAYHAPVGGEAQPVGNPYLQANAAANETPARYVSASGYSVGEIVGIVFFTLLILLPLAIVAASVVITFGAICGAGVGIAIGGVAFTLSCPFHGLLGLGGAAIVANVGIGLAMIGAGLVLFVGFFYATKYTAIAVGAACKFIYQRRKRQ